MPDFVIREAADGDGPELTALLSQIFGAYDGVTFEPGDHPPLDRAASEYSERGGRLWVVAHDGKVAGSLGLLPNVRDGEFALSLVCLEAGSRGQGLAAAMLAGADAFAAASEGDTLVAWIDLRLADGVRFLERQGFVRDPGVRGRQDGSDALEARYSREVGKALSSQPSEAPQAGDA